MKNKANPAAKWRDDFLLGYSPMDDVHQDFIGCVSATLHAEDADVPAAFGKLKQHLEAHFALEDRWMVETHFPPRQCHIDEHAAVMRSASEVDALLKREGNVANCRRFAQALLDWFPGHADLLDSALAHWMCKRTLGGKPVVLRRQITPASLPRA